MLRTTLYGTLTHDEELNKNEKAMLYIKECAELAGLEVIEGETAFSITFMAEIMKRLREIAEGQHQWISASERLPEESKEYFVTIQHTGWNCEPTKFTSTSKYNPKTRCFECENEKWRGDKVIAWMPKPELYKGENNAE